MYQATVFATLLSRQPYYMSVDPSRPARARVCSWDEFEKLVLAEDSQPSPPQKDTSPTSMDMGEVSKEKPSQLQTDTDSAPEKKVDAKISSTTPEQHPEGSVHPQPSKQTPIRQSTLPNSPTRLPGSPPLKPHRQKTAGFLINGMQSNGLRKKISFPQVPLTRLWKRRLDPESATKVMAPAL